MLGPDHVRQPLNSLTFVHWALDTDPLRRLGVPISIDAKAEYAKVQQLPEAGKSPSTSLTAHALHTGLAKTLTTPDSIFTFLHFVILRADIPHEYSDEGILMFHPAATTSAEPKLASLQYIPAAEPSNEDYVAVL